MDQVKKGKKIKLSTQKPQFIDLDNDTEDEEMATRLLLQSKDSQIKEWERDFGMAKYIIQYYKNEHKHLKKIKRGLALQKKMTKYYAMKHKLVCAKLKEALLEAQTIKEEKQHDILGFLSQAFQQLTKTP